MSTFLFLYPFLREQLMARYATNVKQYSGIISIIDRSSKNNTRLAFSTSRPEGLKYSSQDSTTGCNSKFYFQVDLKIYTHCV